VQRLVTYFIKQIVGVLATPMVLGLLIALLGAVCRGRNWPRAARWSFTIAIAVVCLSASGLVGSALLRPLEDKYPALREDQPLPEIRYIVVLGSGYTPHDGIPVTAALDPDGLVRIVEGVRLARRFDTARLLVSGGAPPGNTPPAFGYAMLARSLGIDGTSLIVLSDALDTRQEARAVASLVGATPFLLVTSAYHMPRAMQLMQLAGARPIAVPTGQRAYGSMLNARAWLPGSGGLSRTELALHEYVGLAASAIGLP